MLMACGTASAKPVTPQAARQAAATFLHTDAKALAGQPLAWPTMYLFAIDGGGFVLTSADDRVQPVLAYSPSGQWPSADSQLPASLRWWLDQYDAQIRAATGDETLSTHPGWRGSAPKAVYDNTVGPLMTTTWDQSPYYNDLCPQGTLAGCVAVAMGQVMRYWNWPETGVGSHSYDSPYGPLAANFGTNAYDWQHMPDALTAMSQFNLSWYLRLFSSADSSQWTIVHQPSALL